MSAFVTAVCASVLVTLAGTPDRPADELARLLARAETCRAKDVESLAASVARLPDALEALFAAETTGELRGASGTMQALSAKQVQLLRQTVPHYDMEVISAFLREHLNDQSDDAWRGTALRLLGKHATIEDLSLLGQLVVTERDGSTTRERLHQPFQDAIVAIVERHGWGLRELRWLATELESVRGLLIRAAGAASDPEGLRWLAAQLADPQHQAAALQEIARLAVHADVELAARTARDVRPLAGSKDVKTRKQAVGALRALGDVGSIPVLVAVLEKGETSGERKMAHAALRHIAGIDLPAHPDAWREWYAAEQEWFQNEGQRCMERLASDADAEVLKAIQCLSARTLYRDRIAAELAPLVTAHPSATIRSQTCLALLRLDSSQAMPALRGALEDDDPGVAAQAERALSALAPNR